MSGARPPERAPERAAPDETAPDGPARGYAARSLAWIDATAARWSDWLFSGRAFAAAILSYCLFHALLRIALLPGGSNDDSEQLYHSQSLALGYDANNPPLVTWLVIGMQSLVGVSLASVLLTKFALLALFFLLLYAAARQATADECYAVAAALTPLALYHVGWDALRHYSHSILLILACAATLLLVLRLARSRALVWYVLLGLAVGLGLQAKYNFALFALALFLAALGDPLLRGRLLDRRALIIAFLALACVAPNLVWLIDNPAAVAGEIGSRLSSNADADWLEARALGLWGLVYGLFQFLMPLLVLLVALFPSAFLAAPAPLVEPPVVERVRRAEALLARFAATLLGLFALLVVLGGLARLENHVFFVFILVPIWLFARVSLAARGPAGLHRFGVVVLALCLLASAAAVFRIFQDPLEAGRKAYFNLPYADFANGLREAGFEEGTIYLHDQPVTLSGNLRARLPDARILSSRHAEYRPPERAQRGQCLVVWLVGRHGPAERPPSADHLAAFGMTPSEAYEQGVVTAPLVHGWGRTASLGYRLYDGTTQACR